MKFTDHLKAGAMGYCELVTKKISPTIMFFLLRHVCCLFGAFDSQLYCLSFWKIFMAMLMFLDLLCFMLCKF